MRHLSPISCCVLAASLLTSCTLLDKKPSSTADASGPVRPAWIPATVVEYMPPVVDTKGFNPLQMPDKKAPGYVNPFPAGTYENFAAQKDYPATARVYSDDRLLEQVTATNSKIIICLPQQRARLYVYGRVAMDWPVSTGLSGRSTPTGAFRIMEKSKEHRSSRYGSWVVDGKVTNSDADVKKGAPDGAEFRGADMPNWNRLTWDGVGIHGGRVVPGRRLSHGCIRTPFATARKLFSHTVVGMPVYVSQAVEDYNRGGHLKPEDVRYRVGGESTEKSKSTAKSA